MSKNSQGDLVQHGSTSLQQALYGGSSALQHRVGWDGGSRLKNAFRPSLGSQWLPPRTCPRQSRQLISHAQLLHRQVKLRPSLPARRAAGTLHSVTPVVCPAELLLLGESSLDLMVTGLAVP